MQWPTGPTLFRFCDATIPLSQLRRRQRWSTFVVTAWLCAGIGMIESGVELLLLGSSTLIRAILLGFLLVALVLAIPAIALIPMIEECERELVVRRGLPAGYQGLNRRVPRYVMRMMAAFVAVALVASIRSGSQEPRGGKGYHFTDTHDPGK
jgi:hypothetical protein